MKIVIENADENDFNELAQLARIGRIHTFYLTDEDEGSQDKWIPVSERLPEEEQDVLVCIIYKDTTHFVVTRLLNNKQWLLFSEVEVIAWQPLPEPYKKGGAE